MTHVCRCSSGPVDVVSISSPSSSCAKITITCGSCADSQQTVFYINRVLVYVRLYQFRVWARYSSAMASQVEAVETGDGLATATEKSNPSDAPKTKATKEAKVRLYTALARVPWEVSTAQRSRRRKTPPPSILLSAVAYSTQL